MTALLHPLCGERLAASAFCHRDGELLLVVVLPDGSSGTIRADATDVLGETPASVGDATTLSVEGIRRLRQLVTASLPPLGESGGKPWKALRHRRGADPWEHPVWVCSAHATEAVARRALAIERARFVRAGGYEAAAEWAWSVAHDPAGALGRPGVGEGRCSGPGNPVWGGEGK